MIDTPLHFNRRKVRTGVAALAAVALVTGLTWRGAAATPAAPRPDPVAAAPQAPASRAAAISGRDSYSDIVKTVAPAVVTIRTEGRARMAPTGSQENDLFRQFFGDQAPGPAQRAPHAMPRQMPRQSGLGSGVIVSSDGYILTNHHVIDNADRIHVDLTDGRTVEGKVVGSDQLSDLALVKIDVTGLQPLPLGNSDGVEVGDLVLAVGNPLGLGQTVTMGIISAKGRSTDQDSYEDFLQTDAPINHGNSGGALVNTKGELIGINSQIASMTDGNIGIGFAIPANMAKRVMEDLKSGGTVHRSQLGVSIQAVDSDIAESLGLKDVAGAIVSSVTPGSAADKAGLKRNDIIKSFNGQPVRDVNTLRNRVAESKPGSTATLVIARDGSDRTMSVKLDEKEVEKSAANASPSDREDSSTLGVSVAPVTPALAQRFDIPKGVQGLVVQSVVPDGRASEAGIRPGDVIQQVNRQEVKNVDELRDALKQASNRPALVLVNREGQDIFMTVKPS